MQTHRLIEALVADLQPLRQLLLFMAYTASVMMVWQAWAIPDLL